MFGVRLVAHRLQAVVGGADAQARRDQVDGVRPDRLAACDLHHPQQGRVAQRFAQIALIDAAVHHDGKRQPAVGPHGLEELLQRRRRTHRSAQGDQRHDALGADREDSGIVGLVLLTFNSYINHPSPC